MAEYTISDLISALEEVAETVGDDARVFIMEQPSWPFENRISGITVREDIFHDPNDQPLEREGTAANDVFILSGQQLRMGAQGAWDNPRHRPW